MFPTSVCDALDAPLRSLSTASDAPGECLPHPLHLVQNDAPLLLLLLARRANDHIMRPNQNAAEEGYGKRANTELLLLSAVCHLQVLVPSSRTPGTQVETSCVY